MKIPRYLSGDEVVKVLGKFGFRKVRQKGSHVIMEHKDSRVAVVPVHKGKKIAVGTLLHILRQAGIDRDEFIKAI